MQLTDDIKYLKGIGPKKAAQLARLGIRTAYDLLTYFPRAYEDQSVLTPFGELQPGTQATTAGTIMSVQERTGGRQRRMTILTATLGDGTGFLQVTWFNQKYLKQKLKPGLRLFVTGKVEYAYGGYGQLAMAQVSSWQILGADDAPEQKTGIVPIYPATEQLNQHFFRKETQQLLADLAPLPDVIPASIAQSYHLLPRDTAFRQLHYPPNFETLKAARRTLAFEELYLIQCGLLLLKKQAREQQHGIRHLENSRLVAAVLTALPFQLTHDQQQVWQEIVHDMQSPEPMRRLVQGDVGSGKTVIAMLALVKTVENGYQGALMAPTEILAAQHYESFQQQLTPLGIHVGFLSGRLTKKQREAIYAQLAAHELDIVIGTHALIQDDVHFARLGLVVTDEQHRFGIGQRAALEQKGAPTDQAATNASPEADACQSQPAVRATATPDVLVMTATPIPRTLTLTVYGDLDVSQIKELPPGRQPIRTFVRTPDCRPLIYKYVHDQLAAGRQAYVVCPRIELTEGSDLPSAEEVFDELRYGIFHDQQVGLVHGKMKASEKEAVMQAFYANKIQLLVATTVIEVGVNVPNASLMVIEHAERFGLAQLHQLRGRIGRGPYKSYCILVSEGKSETARERLQIMAETNDGFKLAEEDLRLRGPGQFFGQLQHGLPDLKIADVLGDMDILLEARQAALATLASRETLPQIIPILRQQYHEHFEHITNN